MLSITLICCIASTFLQSLENKHFKIVELSFFEKSIFEKYICHESVKRQEVQVGKKSCEDFWITASCFKSYKSFLHTKLFNCIMKETLPYLMLIQRLIFLSNAVLWNTHFLRL